MSNVAAIILAAGVSARMGKFKAVLEIDGMTMIERVVDVMKRAGIQTILVVTGYKDSVLERKLDVADVQFVHNPAYYRTQMLDSIVLGLRALPKSVDRAMICPVDIPLISLDTIRALLATEGDFVRPVCDGVPGHPVVLARSLFQTLEEYDGKDGLRGAIESNQITPVDVLVEDRGTVLDSDTRDEYAELLHYHRQQTGKPQPLQLDLRIYLQAETSFWEPQAYQLLELVQTTGSILNACQCMHMAYSKAWKMLNEMERQLDFPLLVRNQGGSNGGGSQLTFQGIKLLHAYQSMEQEIQTQANIIFEKYFPNGYLAVEQIVGGDTDG